MKLYPKAPVPRAWRGPAWQAERGSAAEMRETADEATPHLSLEDRQLRQLFTEFDLDGSGELDREEIGQLVARMGTRASEAELDAAMAEMDADGSGEVDFDEFRAWFKQSKGSASKFASAVADAGRLRFNDQGLPRRWAGPQWFGEEQQEMVAGPDAASSGLSMTSPQQPEAAGAAPPGRRRNDNGGFFSADLQVNRPESLSARLLLSLLRKTP
jgi:hypothetical protein